MWLNWMSTFLCFYLIKPQSALPSRARNTLHGRVIDMNAGRYSSLHYKSLPEDMIGNVVQEKQNEGNYQLKKDHAWQYLIRRERRGGNDNTLNDHELKDHLMYIKLTLLGLSSCFLIVVLMVCSWCPGQGRKSSRRMKLDKNATKMENDNSKSYKFTTSASHTPNHNANGERKPPEESESLLIGNQNVPVNITEPIVFEDSSSLPSDADAETGVAPIAIANLANVVKELATIEEGFDREYEKLRGNDYANKFQAEKDENKPKNRFKNILIYDRSRVILQDGEGDYINASYITGYKGRERAYIATQGPLETTAKDFWRMVWQEESSEIIMLANLEENKKKKCFKYWPDEVKSITYGSINVRLVSEHREEWHYTVRTFSLWKAGESETRDVRQYHFTAWGDMADINSATPIWEMWKQLRKDRKDTPEENDVIDNVPIIVHCSAGCGRTGTVITLDVMRKMMTVDKQVDIFNFVNQERTERMMMVQVPAQYRFIYESLLIYYRLKKTCYSREQYLEKLKKWEIPRGHSTSMLEKQFQLFNFLCPKMGQVHGQDGERKKNKIKNRNQHIIPDDVYRPLLQTLIMDDDTSTDYINASFFNGFHKKNAFLATQAPMENTYTDFWRMIFDYKCNTIIGFQGSDRINFPVYWPAENTELGPFVIEKTSDEILSENLTIRTFVIRKTTKTNSRNEKNIRHIKQFCINDLETLSKVQIIMLLVDLITEEVLQWQETNRNPRITVHCEYGVGLSGVFIALYNAIAMLKEENYVDVFTIVKLLRSNRFNMIDNFANYQLVNEAVKYYIMNTSDKSSSDNEDDYMNQPEESTYVNL